MSIKTFKKWLARVRDKKSPWTENEIKYFRKAIGYCGLEDKDYRTELRFEFRDRAADTGYRITAEQDKKGRDYLLGKSIKKDGTRRKGCKLGERELDILRNFRHHKFIDLYENENSFGEVRSYLPIYRAYDRKGNYFEYIGTNYDQMEVIG